LVELPPQATIAAASAQEATAQAIERLSADEVVGVRVLSKPTTITLLSGLWFRLC
jgi:hypothetical protein